MKMTFFSNTNSLNNFNLLDDLKNRDYEIIDNVSDGARLKYWVQKGNIKYLAKSNKKFPTSLEDTYESLSEAIASDLGNAIGVNCVNTIYHRNYILSQVMWEDNLQSFIEYSEELSHSFHLSNLSTFNISTLLNRKTNKYVDNIIDMLLFDIIIGNSDRHPGNFMYSQIRGFYPLFDNGSSLCAYIEDYKIEDILRDRLRWNSIMVTKSKPVLRTDQKITHKELLNILKSNFPDFVSDFRNKLLNVDIKNILNRYDMSEERNKLLTKFLEERINWF